MPYEIKPLACDPTAIKGMSERLIVSHYQNNYGGAVQRLNAITKELAELDFSSAAIFVINGLKREELIAMNSMILHENLFHLARRVRRTRGRTARRADPRFRQHLGLGRRILGDGKGA